MKRSEPERSSMFLAVRAARFLAGAFLAFIWFYLGLLIGGGETDMFGNGGTINGLLAIVAWLMAIASLVAAVVLVVRSERAWAPWLVTSMLALPIWFAVAWAQEHL